MSTPPAMATTTTPPPLSGAGARTSLARSDNSLPITRTFTTQSWRATARTTLGDFQNLHKASLAFTTTKLQHEDNTSRTPLACLANTPSTDVQASQDQTPPFTTQYIRSSTPLLTISTSPPFPATSLTSADPHSPSTAFTEDTRHSPPVDSPQASDCECRHRTAALAEETHQVPLRCKRKFSAFKPARRLPRRSSSGEQYSEWRVYATVVDSSDVCDDFAKVHERSSSTDSHVTRAEQLTPTVRSSAVLQQGAGSKKGRSVRFTGVDSPSESSENSIWHSRSDEDYTPSASTSTFPRFTFPTLSSQIQSRTPGKKGYDSTCSKGKHELITIRVPERAHTADESCNASLSRSFV